MRNFTFSFSAITDFHTPTRFYLMKMRACPTLPLVEQSGMDIKFKKKNGCCYLLVVLIKEY